MMWTGTWNGWSGFFVMLISMVVFWGGMIWVIGYVVRQSSRPRDGRSDEGHAIQILEERFARGDIDGDEFEERKRMLASRTA